MAFTSIDRFLDDTLLVKFIEGGHSTVSYPYTTGWRTMPYAMVAHWQGGDIRYERAGEPPLHVRAGSVLLAPADLAHCVTLASSGTVTCRWAHVHMTICSGLDLLRLLQAPPVIAGTAAAQLGDLCLALANAHDAPHPSALIGIARTRSLEYQLLEALLALLDWSSTTMENVRSISQVLPVLVYIQEHFTADIRRDHLAAVLGISPAQFHLIFKKAMGATPMEYVTRLRIRHAQALLLQTLDSVAAVAEKAGFHDPFHFSRVFHARCGISPAKYRRETRHLPKDVSPQRASAYC